MIFLNYVQRPWNIVICIRCLIRNNWKIPKNIIRTELGQPESFFAHDRICKFNVTANTFVITFFLFIPNLIGGFGN